MFVLSCNGDILERHLKIAGNGVWTWISLSIISIELSLEDKDYDGQDSKAHE